MEVLLNLSLTLELGLIHVFETGAYMMVLNWLMARGVRFKIFIVMYTV